jgi:CheY-like chemotaxis protein
VPLQTPPRRSLAEEPIMRLIASALLCQNAGSSTSVARYRGLVQPPHGFHGRDRANPGRRCADAAQAGGAGRELAAQLATDVLIIEDEALIALDLEALVENLGHKVIVARTRTDAVTIARTKPPGLILADIQLADGSSGLDAVDDLLNTFEVPVIFITAYPERFLTGERPEPAFLVSKPYQPTTVSALVSQALFFERNAVQRKRRAS